MVVNNFDAFGSAVAPDEANSPLIIDANAVLASAISFETLKTIARWGRQIHELFRLMDLAQLALCHSLDVSTQPTGEPAVEQCFSIAIGEGADRAGLYMQRVMNVKRLYGRGQGNRVKGSVQGSALKPARRLCLLDLQQRRSLCNPSVLPAWGEGHGHRRGVHLPPPRPAK